MSLIAKVTLILLRLKAKVTLTLLRLKADLPQLKIVAQTEIS